MENKSLMRSIWAGAWRKRCQFRVQSRAVPLVLLILLCRAPYAVGTPPNYQSLHREQRIDYEPDAADVMRIWTVYVGQGDGLLIQLPPKYNYDPDPTDDDPGRTETVDILIDGGSDRPENETLMESFLLDLYEAPVVIEHAVITHHDGDHVKGLIHILTGDSVGVDSIYHNGLASYRRGKRGFSNSTTDAQAVRSVSGGQLVEGMAFIEPDDDGQGKKLRETDLIKEKSDLEQRLANDEFQNIYRELADAITGETDPIEVRWFQRCVEDGPFIKEREADLKRGVNLSGIEFKLLWPLQRARKYGGWSETINGNSVTFRLDYGLFSMLFAGDHNEKSEEKLIEHLREADRMDLLDVDVLKVPHHGSWHAYEPFFRRPDGNGGYVRPVMSVASMGTTGFTPSWRHPSTEVIQWLGGSHCVYHTLIHEKRFKWSDQQTREDREQMFEKSHILIETDGQWFRIVEVDAQDGDPSAPATVEQTGRSHGTRWIKAQ